MKAERLTTYYDGFNLLTGEYLASGIHRWVYDCPLRSDLVAKVEYSDPDTTRIFANIREWDFWIEHKSFEKVARWLAPCEIMSPDGRILLQKRIDPLRATDKLPDKLPAFLTDVKRNNFGWFEGRIVCCDYAITVPNPSLRLQKAYWD